MQIIIVSCVAPPETIVAGRVNWDIANDQIDRGNKVVIITPRSSRPIGKFQVGKEFDETYANGLRHICIKSYIHPAGGLWGRILESISFGFHSARAIKKEGIDFDVIYCMPWPFLGQLIFLFANYRHRKRVVFNVQDLYPESFLNKIKIRPLNWFLFSLVWLDKFIAKQVGHLTVVSDSMVDVYVNNRKIEPEKITLIENWQDERPFLQNRSSKEQVFQKYGLRGLEGKRVFMYLGNIGPVAGVDDILKDLVDAQIADTIAIVIAGAGTMRSVCEDIVNKHNISYVKFIDIGIGIDSVVELQSIADVLLLPMKIGTAASSIPSKLIAYMFSAKAIISSADYGSATYNAIINAKCGWIKAPDNRWVEIIKDVSIACGDDLKRFGANGREYALSRYSRIGGLDKLNVLLNSIIQRN